MTWPPRPCPDCRPHPPHADVCTIGPQGAPCSCDMASIRVVDCPDPDCGMPAEVLDEYDAESSDGPVHHIRTRCIHGDTYTVLQ